MDTKRLGALTPEVSATLGTVEAITQELGSDGLEDTLLRELVARAAAPLLGTADLGDWRGDDHEHHY